MCLVCHAVHICIQQVRKQANGKLPQNIKKFSIKNGCTPEHSSPPIKDRLGKLEVGAAVL